MYERTSVCLLCASREGSGRANLQPAEPRTQQDTHKATEMGWGCTRYKEGKKLHASLAPSRVKKLGIYLVRLFAERAPLSEARLAARRLAQHLHAPSALHDRLGVAEHRRTVDGRVRRKRVATDRSRAPNEQGAPQNQRVSRMNSARVC